METQATQKAKQPALAPESLQQELEKFLQTAMECVVDPSADESDYDLQYIGKKLALCQAYLDKLSDIQMKLLKINLDVVRFKGAWKGLLDSKERRLKATEEYAGTPREQKAHWVEERTKVESDAYEDWSMIGRMVSMIGEAVGEKVVNVRRQESALRLHNKLIEAKVSTGATSPTAYTGSKASDLDLD